MPSLRAADTSEPATISGEKFDDSPGMVGSRYRTLRKEFDTNMSRTKALPATENTEL